MRFERHEIGIPAGIKHIYLAERFIEEICDRYNIGNDYYGHIVAAVMEAIENGIIHGNKNDEKKQIRILFEAKPGEMIFEIQDEGEGFSYTAVTDPTDASVPISGQEGRGLYIIRSLADEVRFNERGNTIRLHFRITGLRDKVHMERKKKMESFKEKDKKSSKEANR